MENNSKVKFLTGDVVLYHSPFSFNPFSKRRWGNHVGIIVNNHGSIAVNEFLDDTVKPFSITELEGLEIVILRRNQEESHPERKLAEVKLGIKANAYWGCGEEECLLRSMDPDVGYIAACYGIDWINNIEDLLNFPELEVIYKGDFSVKLLKTS